MSEKLNYKTLKHLEGQEIGLSEWLEMTQERINAFAESTEDRQWIHTDPLRAEKSRLGGTVAHGFLLLSLMPYFHSQFPVFQSGFRWAVNYGLNRVRFIHPVKPGNLIRCRTSIKEVKKHGFRKVLVTVESILEIKGNEKPAMASELLALFFV